MGYGVGTRDLAGPFPPSSLSEMVDDRHRDCRQQSLIAIKLCPGSIFGHVVLCQARRGQTNRLRKYLHSSTCRRQWACINTYVHVNSIQEWSAAVGPVRMQGQSIHLPYPLRKFSVAGTSCQRSWRFPDFCWCAARKKPNRTHPPARALP